MKKAYKITFILLLCTLHLTSSTFVIYYASNFNTSQDISNNTKDNTLVSICEYYKLSSTFSNIAKPQNRVVSVFSFIDISELICFRHYFEIIFSKFLNNYIGYSNEFSVAFKTTDIIYPFHYFM